MKEKIEALARQFQQELEGAGTSDAVEKLRVAYLGRKGSVTQLLKGLKEVEAQQKKELGQHINMLKRQWRTSFPSRWRPSAGQRSSGWWKPPSSMT